MGKMHYGDATTSPVLKRTLRCFISNGMKATTRQICRIADVCAVNSIMAALKQNGVIYECDQIRENNETGSRTFQYNIISIPVHILEALSESEPRTSCSSFHPDMQDIPGREALAT